MNHFTNHFTNHFLVLGILSTFLFAGCTENIDTTKVSASTPVSAEQVSPSVIVTIDKIDTKDYFLDRSSLRNQGSFNSEVFVIANNDDKKGFINPSGNVTVSPKYDSVLSLSENRHLVDINDIFQIVDNNGVKIFDTIDGEPLNYTYGFHDGYATFLMGDEGTSREAVVDIDGNVIFETDYYQYELFGNDMFGRVYMENGILATTPYEIINTKGEILATNNGYLRAGIEHFDDNVLIFSNGKKGYREANNMGIMDFDGNEILKPIYNLISGGFYEGRAVFYDSKNNILIINEAGEIECKLPAKYTPNNFTTYNEGLLMFNHSDGSPSEILNSKGEILNIKEYDYIDIMYNGFASCKKNNKFGIIDINGNEILATEYDYLTAVRDNVTYGIKNDETFKIAFE